MASKKPFELMPGSKQTDTKYGVSTKQTDTIRKQRGPKLERMEITQRTKPDKIDSLAVRSRNYARDEFGLDSNAKDIADEAEKRYGKIDVSNYKPDRKGVTSSDFYEKRREYKLGVFKPKKKK